MDHDPIAGDPHRRSIAPPAFQFAGPTAVCQQVALNGGLKDGELGVHQAMADLPDGIFSGPTIEVTGALAPEDNLAIETAHNHLGHVEGRGHFSQARIVGGEVDPVGGEIAAALLQFPGASRTRFQGPH